MQFGDWFRNTGRRSLVVFGDSITVGEGASVPERSWANLLAAALNADLRNAAISGTTLQSSLLADGRPRPDNGFSRYREALLREPADAVAILYGYNDARYTAAPETFNVGAFTRELRTMIEELLGRYPREGVCLGSPPFIPTIGFTRGSPGFTGQSRAGFEEYVSAVKSVAIEAGCVYAPVYERMSRHPDGALASPDITHPNDLGHSVIAGAFFEAEPQ